MGDSDDEEAKKLLAQMGGGDDDDSSDDGSDDDSQPETLDEYMEKYRREIDCEDDELDHVILGTNNLEKALEVFYQMTDLKPCMAVSLKGVGTKSARLAFESCQFVEIMGPDPNHANMPLAKKLAAIPDGELVPFHYAIRSKDKLDGQVWKEIGLGCDKVTMVATEAGGAWTWTMAILENHDYGGLIPYLVDWGDDNAKHAAARLPVIGSLDRVLVQAPDDCPVHKLLDGISRVKAEENDEASLTIIFTSGKGQHTFSAPLPGGIEFPK